MPTLVLVFSKAPTPPERVWQSGWKRAQCDGSQHSAVLSQEAAGGGDNGSMGEVLAAQLKGLALH